MTWRAISARPKHNEPSFIELNGIPGQASKEYQAEAYFGGVYGFRV
jgi:hypothetical protein